MTDGLCWFRLEGPCSGRLQRAHLIPKQRLRRAGLFESQVWDPRAWVWACERHHHRFDHGFVELELDDFPPGLREYAREVGFAWFPQKRAWLRILPN